MEQRPHSIALADYTPSHGKMVLAHPDPVSEPSTGMEPEADTSQMQTHQNEFLASIPSQEIDTYRDMSQEIQREIKAVERKHSSLTRPDEEQSRAAGVTYDIPITINKQVLRYIQYFKTRGREDFKLWLSRSTRYKTLMQEILREHNLPKDLFYLAMIESGFNVNAYSDRHAVGPWQFISSTGRKYGLTINWWIDERRDAIKSTHAAAKYLSYLYKEFGCWYLAMAAYNAGEGKISSAIKKYKSEEFWKLCNYRYLKRETKHFVPKILAAIIISKHPQKYGFNDMAYMASLEFEEISVDGPLSIKSLARATDVSYEELATLNPELKRRVVPPRMRGYILKVPKESKEVLLTHYLALREETPVRPSGYVIHRIHYGDTLYSIARAHGTTVQALAQINNIARPSSIRAGTTILIPSARVSEGASQGTAKSASLDKELNEADTHSRYMRIVHRIRKGDTLWNLSKKYGINWKDFYKWNEIGHHNELRPGDLLTIYVQKET